MSTSVLICATVFSTLIKTKDALINDEDNKDLTNAATVEDDEGESSWCKQPDKHLDETDLLLGHHNMAVDTQILEPKIIFMII